MKSTPDIEREIKILNISVSDILANLTSLHATKKYETTMRIVSFDLTKSKVSTFACKDIQLSTKINNTLATASKHHKEHGSFRDSNAHLRLRYRSDDPNSVELCFKHNTNTQSDEKIALEYNVDLPVEVAKELEESAFSLGLKQVALHEKRRASYRMPNGCICDIDTYPGIPTYVEIEHDSQQIINQTIELLGLHDFTRSTQSGREFFKNYGVDYYSQLTF